jgi:CDGSH-type Zn-finger protein
MAATRITVKHDGSLRIEGDFEILDPEGRLFGLAGRPHVSLCRCGHSLKKPFCDGSHKAAAFCSQVVAFDLEPLAPKPGA